MTGQGIRVRLQVDAAGQCPVAAASAAGDGAVERVDWSRDARSEDAVVEEFTVEGSVENGSTVPDRAELIFESETATRYRFERAPDEACICQAVEALGCPVADVSAEAGTLTLTFYATETDRVESVLSELTERFGDVRVDAISRSGDGQDGDPVLFDRSRLTDRQQEVLKTALEMGYFERPRDANATEVAAELDIALSTFVEHLAAAESKLVEGVVADPAHP